MVAAATTAMFAQGTVSVNSSSAAFAMFINNATYNSSLNGVYDTTGAKTATAANGYYYALLTQTYNAGLSVINPLDANWSLGMMAANNITLAGSIKGVGGAAGAPIAGWAAPTGATYDTAGRDSFILVGWSSSLGSTWASVASQLQSGNWNTGYFGVSGLGNGYAGGGPNSLNAPSIFGASTGMPGGLTGGITMYATPVPEPGTMALAALGGASLLLFRRRK